MRFNYKNRKKVIELTDIQKLDIAIKNSGLKIVFIAKQLGLTREGLYKKLNGETEFKASEISMMQKILGLTNEQRDSIFFAVEVE